MPSLSTPNDEASLESMRPRSVSDTSQISDNSTLSHITVVPRSSRPVVELDINHNPAIAALPDDTLRDNRKPACQPKSLSLAEVHSKKQKVSKKRSTKSSSRRKRLSASRTFEDESGEDIPLIKVIRDLKRKREAKQPDEVSAEDSAEVSEEDVQLRGRRKRRQSKPNKARLNKMVLDDDDLDVFIPKFYYSTRATSPMRSTKTSSSPTKLSEIIYDRPEDVDMESAKFPIKVKHPTERRTLWEINNVNDLKDEVDRRRISNTSAIASRSSVPATPDARTRTAGAGSNRVIHFLDQAEKQFSDSLFFVISTCMHAKDVPLPSSGVQIMNDAAQAWLDVVRRGRADFERTVQTLGILNAGIQRKDDETQQAVAVEEEVTTHLANGNIGVRIFSLP
jgi:hypothetical protein